MLIASLFSAYALIPMLSGKQPEGQHRYIDAVTVGFGAMMFVVSAVAYALIPVLMPVLFPGLTSAGGMDVILLSRILLLQPILLGLSNILAAITQTHRQYLLYALAPILYNIGIIAGLIVLYPLFGTTGLAWGVVLGALLHVCIQLPSVVARGFFTRLPRLQSLSELKETLFLSLPRTLALGVGQIVQMVLIIIAGLLAPGSIAVFTFAFNLQAVPLAVIGASYSVAAFPTLARMASEGDMASFVLQVVSASRHILFWSMPAIALMIVLRAHIVRVILGSGAFDWTDTRLTAASFALFSLALVASALSLLIIRAYYAAGRSYLPLVVSVGSAVGAVGSVLLLFANGMDGVGLFLESLLRVEDVPGTVMLILPLTSSLAAILGAIAFVSFFEAHFGGFVQGISRIFWESLTAAGIAGSLAYATLAYLGGIGPATTLALVVFHGIVAGLAGLAGSAMVYWFFGSPEFYEAVAAFKRRPHVVAPVASTEETITT